MAQRPPTLIELGEQRKRLRGDLSDLNEQIRQRVLSEHAGGHGKSEAQLAREAGVDRMTIRKWLGK
jgi:hypothetical protein